MKLIDAHMHLPMKETTPANAFVKQIIETDLDGFVLILNEKAEKELFNVIKGEIDSQSVPYSLVIACNPGDEEDLKYFSRWKEEEVKPHLKFHPRLHCISKDDFRKAAETVERVNAEVVTICTFTYGHNIQHHTGIDLTIYLAEQFKEKKFVMAHFGGIDILKALLYTRTLQDNVFFDISLTQNYFAGASTSLDLIHALKFEWQRTIFGSDYPDFSIKEALEATERLCNNAGLSQKQIQSVLYDNAERVYFN